MTRKFKNNRVKDVLLDVLLLLMFLFMGILIFLEGAIPRTIEIDPTGEEVTAKLYKRSVFSPFNKEESLISNVKQAVITKMSIRKSFSTCKVELESYSGYKSSITTNFFGCFFKRRLQNQINASIQNKIPLKKSFIDIYLSLCGIIIILLTILSIILYIKGTKLYKEWKIRREKYKDINDFEISLKGNQQQSIEPEQGKYKDINDSIIR